MKDPKHLVPNATLDENLNWLRLFGGPVAWQAVAKFQKVGEKVRMLFLVLGGILLNCVLHFSVCLLQPYFTTQNSNRY